MLIVLLSYSLQTYIVITIASFIWKFTSTCKG